MRFTIALLFVFGLFKISSTSKTKYCVEVQTNGIGKLKNYFVEIIDNKGENCQKVSKTNKAYEYTSEKGESLSIKKHYQCSKGDMVEYTPLISVMHQMGGFGDQII